MAQSFPRTTVGGVSLSRLIIGTNWFLGWSHCTAAKDDYIKENVRDAKKIAAILEVFLNNGVDTVMGLIQHDPLRDGIAMAQDRTGKKMTIVSTPGFPADEKTPENGFDLKQAEAILDEEVKRGTRICMPHTSVTDKMIDLCTRKVRHMDQLTRMIRERGMIPGLSTHVPETIVFADESGLDVESYISIYNAMGFLMHLEVDWTHRIICDAKKPVMTIKPLAAGQLRPFQGLSFVWSTLRDIDMVTVGTMSPKEAQECVDISLSVLEKRRVDMKLQETRSKETVKSKNTKGKA